jgi:hypothetical protein
MFWMRFYKDFAPKGAGSRVTLLRDTGLPGWFFLDNIFGGRKLKIAKPSWSQLIQQAARI